MARPSALDDRYTLGRLLGEGATAAVYQATDSQVGREVAVKFLHFEQWDEHSRERFFEEARILSRLNHPNIVRIFDYASGDEPYIVMELVEGATLHTYLRQRGILPLATALSWMAQLLDAVGLAHSKGILHRDIKSQNVMVDSSETIKVADFGLARRSDRTRDLTATGIVMGTPSYMAPEVISGAPALPASDVYSAGVLLFEMVTGSLPFENEDVGTLLRAHLATPPPDPRKLRPELPPKLAATMLCAMVKDATERYTTCTELRAALEAASTGEVVPPLARTVVVPREAPASAPRPRSFRKPLVAFAVCLIMLLLYLPASRERLLTINAGFFDARATWRTSDPCGVTYEVQRAGKICLRGQDGATLCEHAIHLRGLEPGSSYRLVVTDDEGTLTSVFQTTRPTLTRGVFACALRGFLCLDFETNCPEGLVVRYTGVQGKETQRRLSTGSGPVTLPYAESRPDEVVRWRLEAGRRTLAHGTTSTTPVRAARFADPNHVPKETRHPLSPRHPPVWVGERFVIPERTGVVSCYEMVRTTGPSLRFCWALRPPDLMKRSGAVHPVGSIVRLSGGKVLVLCIHRSDAIQGYCLDVEARARMWRRRFQGDAYRNFEGPMEGWNEPLAGTEEWVHTFQGLEGCRLRSGSVVHRGLVYVPLGHMHSWQKEARVGVACLDPRGDEPRCLWVAPISYEALRDCPYHRVTAVEATWTRGGLPKKGGCFVLSDPIVVGGRVYYLAGLSSDRRQGRGPCALVSCPATEDEPPSGARAHFRFENDSLHQQLGKSMARREVWVTGRRHLYQWSDASSARPRVHPVIEAGAFPSNDYLSGAPLITATGQYVFQSHVEALTIALPVARFTLTRLGLAGAACTIPRTTIEDATPKSLPDIRMMARSPSGGLLTALSVHKVFVHEPASQRSGWYELTTFQSLEHGAIGDRGAILAVADIDGGVYALPLHLVLDAGADPRDRQHPRLRE